MGAEKTLSYTQIKIPKTLYSEIKKLIEVYPVWRNPTEFAIEAIRTQLFKIKETLKEETK